MLTNFDFFYFLPKLSGVHGCCSARTIISSNLQSGVVRLLKKMPISKRSLSSWMGSSKDGEDDSTKKKHAGTSQKAQKGPDFSKVLVPIYSPQLQ